MKLTLKDYAPYLASGLKIADTDELSTTPIIEVVGLLQQGSNLVIYGKDDSVYDVELQYYHKPYFRPLSSLYKPLKDGSVPIVQLAKIVDDYSLSDSDWDVERTSNVFVEIVAKETMPIQKFKIFFHPYFEIEYYEVVESGDRYERGMTTEQHLEFFDYLYANHFWLGDQSYFEKGIILNLEEIEE